MVGSREILIVLEKISWGQKSTVRRVDSIPHLPWILLLHDQMPSTRYKLYVPLQLHISLPLTFFCEWTFQLQLFRWIVFLKCIRNLSQLFNYYFNCHVIKSYLRHNPVLKPKVQHELLWFHGEIWPIPPFPVSAGFYFQRPSVYILLEEKGCRFVSMCGEVQTFQVINQWHDHKAPREI